MLKEFLSNLANAFREKLGTTDKINAQDFSNKVAEVYKAGQKSMVDESKIIKKTVTGTNFIYVDDVSEIPHEYKIKLSSDTITDFSNISISRYGTNLFTFENRTIGDFGASGNTTIRNLEEDKYYFRVSGNNHYGSQNTFEILDNNSVRMTTINAYGLGVPFKVLPNYTYSISCDKSDSKACAINVGFYNANGTHLDTIYGATSWTVPENCEWMLICFVGVGASGEALEIEFRNIQLELGSTSAKFEQYTVQTVKANADGIVEGITSISPKTLLISSDNNTNISLTYHKSFGAQLEYDRFWDTFQDYGNRDFYPYAFGSACWVGLIDKMKYPIKICSTHSAGCSNMFAFFNRNKQYNTKLYDMTELSKKIDFSQAKDAQNVFSNARVKNLTCDFSNVTVLQSTFSSGNGGIIENLTLKVTEKCTNFANPFYYQTAMTTIRFTDDSVIAASISFNHSPLTKESITNIINTLSLNVTGCTVTFKKSAVDTAFETAEGLGDGSTSAEWLALIATKPNWTVTLV